MSELAWQRTPESADDHFAAKGEPPYTAFYHADVLGRWAGRYGVAGQGANRGGWDDRYDPETHVWRRGWVAGFNELEVEHGAVYQTLDAAKAACQRHRDDRTDVRLARVFLAAAAGIGPPGSDSIKASMEAAFRAIGEMFRKAGE